MISPTDLVALIVLGVLLPGAFLRPSFIGASELAPHVRMRWDYCYSMFAFAILGFVDVAAIRLLRPAHALTASARGALTGAAVLVVVIAAAVHLPPIVHAKRRRLERWLFAGGATVLGVGIGGFLAVDLVYPQHGVPGIALVSWMVLLGLSAVTMIWFSGLSPETRFNLYRRRRRKRSARPHR